MTIHRSSDEIWMITVSGIVSRPPPWTEHRIQIGLEQLIVGANKGLRLIY
jgi:hypothetical protein